MTTVPATMVAMAVLTMAGLLPVLALVGLRWITIPLAPLAGAVLAAMAATAYLGIGGTFIGWFVALAVVGAGAVGAQWVVRPDRRLRVPMARRLPPHPTGYRATGAIGAVAIVAASVWSLRGLSTPTVGFDARAVWLLRAGWFLQPHHQLLSDMRVSYVPLIQSAYPPLVSASTAVAWSITGNHSLRLGVVVVALLNTCALAIAAFALVEGGRQVAFRLARTEDPRPRGEGVTPGARSARVMPVAPEVAGVVAAVLLVFIAFGITEPFMTNGYADPIWSLAAVGAVAYGLQMRRARSEQGATLVLVLVAGMSKDEGLATAVALIVLLTLRAWVTMPADQRHRHRWRPVGIGAVALAAVGAWPVLMRVLHARGESASFSPTGDVFGRARATFDGMAPYLHVLVLAAPLAIVGGLVLATVRRRGQSANDAWAWAGVASGLVAVSGALIFGSGTIGPWLATTVHRVTEFPALAGWWIVATWAVVASGAPAMARQRRPRVPRPRGQPDGSPAAGTVVRPRTGLIDSPLAGPT